MKKNARKMIMEISDIKKQGRINNRITFGINDECFTQLTKLENEFNLSRSEILRRAIFFYDKHRKLHFLDDNWLKKVDLYIQMLSTGEHLILDLDHYLSMLKFIEGSSKSRELENFWTSHKEISYNHADQFIKAGNTFYDVINRLEACNFFKAIKESPNQYTLLLGSNIPLRFIKSFLIEVFSGMQLKVNIKEGFTKLNIEIDYD